MISPDPDDPLFIKQPGQFRAELHDRLLAPLYPLAFVMIAFAFLGAPRTTRQSRAWRWSAVILGVSGVAPDRLRQHRVRHRNIRSRCSVQYVALAVDARLYGLLRHLARH